MAEFWKDKTLDKLSETEWESLCDGCGKCCLNKLETQTPDVYVYTRIACKLLDAHTCQCSNYPNRFKYVKDCAQLSPDKLKQLTWLPDTCAYRLVNEGKSLPDWHHLVCGDKDRIHHVDMSVRNAVVSEEFVHEDGWQEHIIQWVNN